MGKPHGQSAKTIHVDKKKKKKKKKKNTDTDRCGAGQSVGQSVITSLVAWGTYHLRIRGKPGH